MKETIILLYFLQADYGRRLLRFLTRKKNKQIRLELMTERERVMWRTETENQRIVVLTDDEGLYAEAKKEVILLGKEMTGSREDFTVSACRGHLRGFIENSWL